MTSYLESTARIEKYFRGTKYNNLVDIALSCYEQRNYTGLKRILEQFPTDEQLFEQLVEKLKGKSVYKNLATLLEKKGIKGDLTGNGKAVSSLITHTLIEIEKGNKEFSLLIPILYERLGNILYAI